LYELRTFNEADLFENGIVKEHIHIMTIHKAKGLQFDNVIVCDVSEGTFPLYWSRNQEEDARTLYVALSRAKKRLYITYITAPSIFMKSIHKRFDLMERNAMKELLRIEESYKKAGDVEV
jgi:DNA helicase-2/ATP-dependent DNA helicase PcrA